MNEDEVYVELDQLKSRISFLIGLMQKKLRIKQRLEKMGEVTSSPATKESYEEYLKRKAEEMEGMELVAPMKMQKVVKERKPTAFDLVFKRIHDLYKPEERFAQYDLNDKIKDLTSKSNLNYVLKQLEKTKQLSKEAKYGTILYWYSG